MNKHTVMAACVAAAALTALTGCGAGQTPSTSGSAAASTATPTGSGAGSEAGSGSAAAPNRPAGLTGTLYYSPLPGTDAKYSLQRLSGDRLVGLVAANRSDSIVVSPNGTKIAFISDTTLWVADGNGANERKLGTGFVNVGYEPVWSPTGDRLLVARGKPDGAITPGILTIATGTFTTLAHNPGGIHYLWSADGKHLAYATGTCQIGTADTDGSNTHLIPNVHSCDPFSISPDGTRLALDIIEPGQDAGDIAPNRTADTIINTTTGKTITIPVDGQVTQVIFRPDGTTLVRSTRQGTTTLTLLNADLSIRAAAAEPGVAKSWLLMGYS